ncbi:hypothetical protein HN011_008913 [Eciton burchellii]|nr:hypothetical protein HN011_008913 [Eciton burchellii]
MVSGVQPEGPCSNIPQAVVVKASSEMRSVRQREESRYRRRGFFRIAARNPPGSSRLGKRSRAEVVLNNVSRIVSRWIRIESRTLTNKFPRDAMALKARQMMQKEGDHVIHGECKSAKNDERELEVRGLLITMQFNNLDLSRYFRSTR